MINGHDESLPFGLITPESHSFSGYVEVFHENGKKVEPVYLIDCRTAMAYAYIRKNKKVLYDNTGKPVLEEVPIKLIRLMKHASEIAKKDFEAFYRYFKSLGDHDNKSELYFGIAK